MSQNRCYLCGSSDVNQEEYNYVLESKFENFYRFNNKIVHLCGDCFDFLRDKYGTHKNRLGLSNPNFYKSKTKGGFFSEKVDQKHVTGKFKSDLKNNLDGLREEARQTGQELGQEREDELEAVQKEFQIVLKRWDEVLTKILEQTNAKTTAKDIFKFLKKSKITEPTNLKFLEWEALEADWLPCEDSDFDFNEDSIEVLDPYYIVNKDLTEWNFSNEEAFKMCLENRVFDPKSKIKRTGNFRYYLSSNEESKGDNL